MTLQKVTAVRDESCHWYVIPSDLTNQFYELSELMNSENQTVFEQAEDKFISLFEQYRTGGDVNNIQLYAEI